MSPARFQILFVCTANVCRSVFAERLTRRAFAARLGPEAARFVVTSAGTNAATGRGLHPHVGSILAARAADVDGFASRRLRPELVNAADLVLTATQEHRDRAIALAPAALKRCFTLPEFVRLSGYADLAGGTVTDLPGRARAVVAAAQQCRGRAPYVDPASDALPDPRPTARAFAESADRIGQLSVAVVEVLTPAPVTPSDAEPGPDRTGEPVVLVRA